MKWRFCLFPLPELKDNSILWRTQSITLILQSSSTSNFYELLINGLCLDIPQRQHPPAAAAAVEGGSSAAATFPGVPTPTDQQPLEDNGNQKDDNNNNDNNDRPAATGRRR